MEENMKVVVIDTGVDTSHPMLKQYKDNITIISNIGKMTLNRKDSIGHGTAIIYSLLKNMEDLEIISLNIFDKSEEVCEELLIESLEYVYSNIKANIIHISSGIVYPKELERLEIICNMFEEKKVFIVSAFDNEGRMSYPACLESVIGVSISNYCCKNNDYILVENSPINFLTTTNRFYLPSSNKKMKFVAGSSFSSIFITLKLLEVLRAYSFNELYEEIKRDAIDIISFEFEEKETNFDISNIRNAAIFPFNKEMHSLISNADLLNFKIKRVFDLPFSTSIGKNTSEIVFKENGVSLQIESISKFLNNEIFGIDTIIVGHIYELQGVYKTNYIELIIKFCLNKKIKVYFLDDLDIVSSDICSLDTSNSFYFYSNTNIWPTDFQDITFGKQYNILNLCLAVCGTSPHQGKLNVQLDLRRDFLEQGYTVSQIGTEPTSNLYGMDLMFHNGYGTNVKLSGKNEILYYSYKIRSLPKSDITIVGFQSNTISYSFGNVGFYPISQQNLLLATRPDLIVLCINIQDDKKYIKNTIFYLTEILDAKVLAIVIYPRKFKNYIYTVSNELEVSKFEIQEKINEIKNFFDGTILINGDDNYSKVIVKKIVNTYGESED